ncbi:MAG: hypothetical protein ABFD52_10505 [Acidobacteriota bacterium]
MVATETAKTVVLILFGLSILWIVVIIVRNDMQTIIRALIVAALLGLALYYVGHTKLEKLSFQAVKEELFPVRARDYSFDRREGYVDGRPTTTFVFQDPGPPLSLVMMSGGKHMAIKDIRPVNVVLEYLGLPPVAAGVPELAAATGHSMDADKFRWDDYEGGVLLLERGICRDLGSAQTFTCIARITVTAR